MVSFSMSRNGIHVCRRMCGKLTGSRYVMHRFFVTLRDPPADKINTGWISSRSQSIVQWSRIEVTSLDAEILALVPTARLRNPLTSPCSCSAYSLTVWSSCRVPRRIRGIIWSVHLCSLFIWPKMILGVGLQNRRSQSSAGCVHTWFIWFTSRRDDLNFFHFEIQF